MNLSLICNELEETCYRFQNEKVSNLVTAVKASLQREDFHIAVLGEFKRGKSTLINSLLGEEILPTDILPMTANIHIIQYGETPSCSFVWQDGKIQTFSLEKETLLRAGRGGDLEESNIKYIRILYPNELLRKFTIIDTPGANDISRARTLVTDTILPYCDAGLFLLDSAAPLSRSEADFLQAKVLSNKLDSLIFILSKSDRLDEEELEEALIGAKKRLKKVYDKEVFVLPYSSREVIKDQQLGIAHIDKQKLSQLLELLKKQADFSRHERYLRRLEVAIDWLLEEVSLEEGIHSLQNESVKKYQKSKAQAQMDIDARFHQLLASIEIVGHQTLLKMIESSCNNLTNSFIQEIEYQIRMADGNLEKLWEQKIPIQIERTLQKFSENKANEIQIYLSNFSKHVASEYEKNFELPLKSSLLSMGVQIPQWEVAVNNESASALQRYIQTNLPLSAGAVLGTLIFPGVGTIIGGALGGMMQTYNNQNRIEKLKQEYLELLPIKIQEIVSSYCRELCYAINICFSKLNSSIIDYHHQQEQSIKKFIEKKLTLPEVGKERISIIELNDIKIKLGQWKQELTSQILQA